jgi:hypothetical protein
VPKGGANTVFYLGMKLCSLGSISYVSGWSG